MRPTSVENFGDYKIDTARHSTIGCCGRSFDSGEKNTMKIKINLLKAALLLIALGFAAAINAQTERDRRVFGGFNRVGVSVSDLNEDVKGLGLSAAQITADAEDALQKVGLTVDANAPQQIYVNLKTTRTTGNNYAYAIILYVDQGVVLQRDNAARFSGTTWDISGIYTSSGANLVEDVREQVLALIDEFAVKYNSVNRSGSQTANPPSDEGSPFTTTKIAGNLPPELYITNKTGRTVYITVNGGRYVVKPGTKKTIAATAGNAVYQGRIAGFNAFKARTLVLRQGEGYSLTYTVGK